jgi:hypothetical protein
MVLAGSAQTLLLHAPTSVSTPHAVASRNIHFFCWLRASLSMLLPVRDVRSCCCQNGCCQWTWVVLQGSETAISTGMNEHMAVCSAVTLVNCTTLLRSSRGLLSRALSHHTQPPATTPSSQWACCGWRPATAVEDSAFSKHVCSLDLSIAAWRLYSSQTTVSTPRKECNSSV